MREFKALFPPMARKILGAQNSGQARLERNSAFVPIGKSALRHLCARSLSRNDSPCSDNFSASRFVQSQFEQAHGSVPFSCRQFLRLCASLILSSSKYFSQ
jgi:hypothetical protein